ncbi:hypothetical protein FHG87_006989 [Trinorchestia longiramus]|nr:hypothetical protein FHG87_006989 [Trinorchestia longiramus]
MELSLTPPSLPKAGSHRSRVVYGLCCVSGLCFLRKDCGFEPGHEHEMFLVASSCRELAQIVLSYQTQLQQQYAMLLIFCLTHAPEASSKPILNGETAPALASIMDQMLKSIRLRAFYGTVGRFKEVARFRGLFSGKDLQLWERSNGVVTEASQGGSERDEKMNTVTNMMMMMMMLMMMMMVVMRMVMMVVVGIMIIIRLINST